MPTDLDDAEHFMLLSALEKLRFGKAVSNSEIESAIAGRHVGKHRGPCLCFNKVCKESSDIVRMDPATIQEKLCRFVMEVRRQDGAYATRQTVCTGLSPNWSSQQRRESIQTLY